SSDLHYLDTSFDSTGIYYADFTYVNGCGTDSTIRDSIVISENTPWSPLRINSEYSKTCPNEPIYFSIYGTFQSIVWSFSDGSSASGNSVTHVFSTGGMKYITATVTNYCGNDTVLTDSVEISLNLPFRHDASMNFDNDECPGTPMYFEYGGNYARSMLWDFGDGVTAISEYPVHSYSDYGSYPLKLSLTNGCGSDTTLIDTVHIINNDAYTNMRILQNEACPGDLITLQGYIPDDTKSVLYDYGDGYFTTDRNEQSHRYSEPGVYPFKTIVTNNCGNIATSKDTVVIKSTGIFSGNTVHYRIYPRDICPGDSVILSTDNWSKVTWDPGNGIVDHHINTSTTFTDEGYHTIRLTLENACGIDTVITDSVQVKTDIDLRYIYVFPESAEIFPGGTINFEATDCPDYYWEFGDTTTSTLAYPEHVYRYPGIYYAKVTGTNGCGSSLSDSAMILVADTLEMPVPIIYKNPVNQCPGDPVAFSYYLDGGKNTDLNMDNYTANWHFADEDQTGSNILHSFSAPGEQPYSLTITGTSGKTVTVYDTILIGDGITSTNSNINLEVEKAACAGDSVGFRMISRENMTIDFGDGTQSTDFLQLDINGISYMYTAHAYSQQGNYKVKAFFTNGCGEVITDSVAISVNSFARTFGEYEVTPQQTYCINEAVKFTFMGVNQLLVDFGDGETTRLDGAMYRILEHRYQHSGTYAVIITMVNSCGDSAQYTETIEIGSCEITSVTESKTSGDEIICFPNPVNNNLTIRFIERTAERNTVYMLYDLNGSKVLQGNIEKDTQDTQLDLQNIPKGIYLLRITSDKENYVLKVVKE
ncbi:MAG TPA: PKD domain-containing protein, partial [Bacteroidales bacterium]|nr:PKD domain-containing protein [Bacteroidales bacterium]